MKRLAFTLLALLFASCEVAAQSSPNFSYGQVPTAKQWNDAFASKQDRLTFAPLNPAGGTMQGRLQTAPSTVNAAGLSIMPGTAPNAPVNGDIWATTVGLYSRVGGRTLAIPGLDQATGALIVPNGPTLGTYQNGQYTSQPDAIQLQSGGLTCAAGATCDVTPGKVTATGASAGQTLGGWFSSLVFGTPTVTSLRAYSRLFIAPNSLITVGGYTSLGDGGGGSFYWSNTSTATDDGVLVINPTGNGGAGRWLRIFNGRLPVEAAGALCDGGSNDTVPFQKAINVLGAQPRGGIAEIGAKACVISGTLNAQVSNVALEGKGASSALIVNFPAGDVIRFGSDTAQYSNFTIRDFVIASSVSRTSGAAINDYNGVNLVVRGVRLIGGYDGIVADSKNSSFNQAQLRIENVIAEGLTNECFSFGRNSATTATNSDGSASPALFVNGVYVLNSVASNCGTGAALYSISGGYFSGLEVYKSVNNGIVFAPTTAHLGIQGVWFNQTLADSSAASGWYVAGTGKIGEVKITASQASTSGAHGFDIEPGTNLDSLWLTDFQSTANGQHGLRIGGGANVNVRGGEYYYNGNGPGGVGIAVENNVKGFSITGINSGLGGWAKLNITDLTNQGKPMKQTNCIYVVGPANDNYNITSNRCMGNTSTNDQLHDGGTGTNKVVSGNLTY